jgi:hypothetical protein
MYSGIYYINDDMNNYMDYQDNLPNVQVNEIEINYIDNRIYAGTYGRGVWSAPTYATSNQIDASVTASSSTTFCSGESVVLSAAQETGYTYQWLLNGIDIQGETSYQLTINASGDYSVEVTSEGETLESDPFTIMVNQTASEPTVQDVIFCNSGDAVTFQATSPTGIIKWYDASSGGNLLSEGEDFSSSPTQTTTYYVAQSSYENTLTNGGALDNTLSAGGNHAGGYGLEFDVFKNMILKSTDVYAQGAGDRNFVLKDANGVELENETISLVDGKNTITLDWHIEQGSDYIISCEKIGGADVNLFRNSGFTSFPFPISDILTIVQGTADGVETEYYYYFYNWLVEEDQVDCPSNRVAVTATLDLCTSQNELSEIEVEVFPNPVHDQLTIRAASELQDASWSLFDIQGRLLDTGLLNLQQFINFDQYVPGNYVLRIQSNNEVYTTEVKKK